MPEVFTIRSRHYIQLAIGFLVTLLLAMPAWGQPQNYAPVTVDSRQIFRVADVGQVTASQRSETINAQLRQAVYSQQAPKVKLELRNKLPIVTVNDRYLLTVTQNDTIGGQNPTEQATTWVNSLLTALDRAQQERSPEFIQEMAIMAVGTILAAIAIHWLLGKIWKWAKLQIERLQPDLETDEERSSLDLLFKPTLFLVRLATWMSVLLYVTNLFPLTRQWSYSFTSSLIASLTSPIFARGAVSYSIISLLLLIVMLVGTIVLSGTIARILRTRVLRVMRLNRGAEASIAILIKYALIAIGSLAVLQLWGLDLSSLTILASALGIGIGFGFQNIVKDFGSGLILLFERPIQVGDFVEVNGYKGTVEQINLRSTVIDTLDRIAIVVPNSYFLDKETINWSYRNPISRVHLPVGVAYGSDVNLVKATLLEVVRSHPEVLPTPLPNVLFKGFGDSSLDFDVLIWIQLPERQVLIKSDLFFAIEAAFRQQQIELPFPQRDLHIRSGGLPLKLSAELERALLEKSTNGDRE